MDRTPPRGETPDPPVDTRISFLLPLEPLHRTSIRKNVHWCSWGLVLLFFVVDVVVVAVVVVVVTVVVVVVVVVGAAAVVGVVGDIFFKPKHSQNSSQIRSQEEIAFNKACKNQQI